MPDAGGGADELQLRLHLLDHQVVDPDDRLVCKVDDLELEIGEDGRPYVTALLCGPLALGPRLGGRLGSWVVAVARRLSPEVAPAPGRIDFRLVDRIASAVSVTAYRRELGVTALEDWVDTYVIDRIPGSHHESE